MPDKRIFIAIHYHPTLDFLQWFQGLKRMARDERVKWTDTGNFHLTLKFIGDTPDPLIDSLASSLRDVAATCLPFELTPKGFGYFGSPKTPRVFWLGIEDPSQTLATLAIAVDEICHFILQTPLETLPFKAHLTLGRPKSFASPEIIQTWVNSFQNTAFQPFRVEDIQLVWSTLTSSGPIYKTLENFTLGNLE